MSRPFLENGVRRRLLRLPNVGLRQRSEVEEPVSCVTACAGI
jgi:hypothetical protein